MIDCSFVVVVVFVVVFTRSITAYCKGKYNICNRFATALNLAPTLTTTVTIITLTQTSAAAPTLTQLLSTLATLNDDHTRALTVALTLAQNLTNTAAAAASHSGLIAIQTGDVER